MAPSQDRSARAAPPGSGRRSGSRLIAVSILIALLTPGLWWRSPAGWPRANATPVVHFEPLAARSPTSWPTDMRLVGAWHLTSRNNRFGGYSALLATDETSLTAISDIGRSLRFRRPDLGPVSIAQFGRIGSHDGWIFFPDIESATWDPASGARWYGYERSNRIRRFVPGDDVGEAVRPRAMRGWPANGGAEAMTRLPDGRFIVLSEDPPWLSAGGRPGLLFPSDPVAGAAPLEFTFRPPIGYHPSDMAALPDGRVVILLRAIDPPFPPFFKSMLLVADPAGIVAGHDWPWRKLAALDSPLPRDNYEGLAITPDAQGVTLWLISDDNFTHVQRTLLLELDWDIPLRKAAAR